MEAVLTIAGSDCSGGAGIQADIKTIQAHQLYAESVITALTAQNTLGVTGVVNIEPEFVEQQIDAVFEDIRPAAVKIGMVSSPEIVISIVKSLMKHQARNVVVDPVMVATSGSSLIADDAVKALQQWLFPLADVITPNLAEAEVLCGFPIKTKLDVEAAAEVIGEGVLGGVLIKGGHGDAANDFLRLANGQGIWYEASRIENDNTHGTGCTLSSAIACGLAMGQLLPEAVGNAKNYVRGALTANLDLGQGSGPLDHMWAYHEEPAEDTE